MTDTQMTNEMPQYLNETIEGSSFLGAKMELEMYLKLLKQNQEHMINDRTFLALNPSTIDPEIVGEKMAKDIKKWWTEETKYKVFVWLDTNKHKCNGKYGNWNCGFVGSRWADCKINGRECRLAFYSRKYNLTSIQNIEAFTNRKYDYAIMIDPTN